MSSRPSSSLFRLFRASRPFQTFTRPAGRRFQSTASPTEETARNPFQRLWRSPVGVKTVHFWAPVMKWSLVLAGISDFSRPAENLSLTQNLALTATGTIWTRWCFIIKPQNLLLAAVNFFLAGVGVTQVARILMYQRSVKAAVGSDLNATPSPEETSAAKEAKGVVVGKGEGVLEKVRDKAVR